MLMVIISIMNSVYRSQYTEVSSPGICYRCASIVQVASAGTEKTIFTNLTYLCTCVLPLYVSVTSRTAKYVGASTCCVHVGRS